MIQPINGMQTQYRKREWISSHGARSRRGNSVSLAVRFEQFKQAVVSHPQKATGVALACVAGLLALTIAGQRPVATPSLASAVLAPVTVPMTVKPGDTLWSLAKRYGDPNAYILDRVDTLAAANGVETDAHLIPGQRLLIPVKNPTEIALLQQHLASAQITR